MDFIDRLKALSATAHARVPHTRTEEAAKTALVMPFLRVLGYDVFDPQEVVPEYVADLGVKKAEKVDYAILRDGKPVIIIECKAVGSSLDFSQVTQLFRYFASTPSRFGILTDGIIYRFFADLEERNKMDQMPFLEFDLSEITSEDAKNLKQFTKDSFDLADSIKAAENLKYTTAIKEVLAGLLKRPSEGFVRFILDQVHGGPKTKSRIAKFTDLTRSAFREFIKDRINDRLQSALESEGEEPEDRGDAEDEVSVIATKVVTTDEELRAFEIVKEILRDTLPEERLELQDRQRYCNVVLDGSRAKNIVRLFFNNPKSRHLTILDEQNRTIKHAIGIVDEIHDHAEVIRARVQQLLG